MIRAIIRAVFSRVERACLWLLPRTDSRAWVCRYPDHPPVQQEETA